MAMLIAEICNGLTECLNVADEPAHYSAHDGFFCRSTWSLSMEPRCIAVHNVTIKHTPQPFSRSTRTHTNHRGRTSASIVENTSNMNLIYVSMRGNMRGFNL